jgi:hypothetical protein
VTVDPSDARRRSVVAERTWKRGLLHQRWSVRIAFVAAFIASVVFVVKPQFAAWVVPGAPVDFMSFEFGVLIIVSGLSVYVALGVAKLVSILVDMWFDRHNEPARVTSARLARERAATAATDRRGTRPPFSG